MSPLPHAQHRPHRPRAHLQLPAERHRRLRHGRPHPQHRGLHLGERHHAHRPAGLRGHQADQPRASAPPCTTAATRGPATTWPWAPCSAASPSATPASAPCTRSRYPIGGMFHVPHGVANTLVLPWAMEYNMLACLQLVHARSARPWARTWTASPTARPPRRRVAALRQLADDLDVPQYLSDVGIPESAIPDLVEGAMTQARLWNNNPRKFTRRGHGAGLPQHGRAAGHRAGQGEEGAGRRRPPPRSRARRRARARGRAVARRHARHRRHRRLALRSRCRRVASRVSAARPPRRSRCYASRRAVTRLPCGTTRQRASSP